MPSTTSSPTPPRNPSDAAREPVSEALARLSISRRRQVFTHRSWVVDRTQSYERLEFLGDSVLQLVVTADLMRRHPAATEGDLAWMRQSVVGGGACAEVAVAAGLDQQLLEFAADRDGADDAPTKAQSPKVRAALVEALIGSVWLDLGEAAATDLVLTAFGERLAAAVPGQREPKSAMQEFAARHGLSLSYRLDNVEGPPHERVFHAVAVVGGQPLGAGLGTSKRVAEQAAAAEALGRLTRNADEDGGYPEDGAESASS